MTRSSTSAADRRAAQAALSRPKHADHDFDRYLLIDDTDEFITEIHTVLRKHRPRFTEV